MRSRSRSRSRAPRSRPIYDLPHDFRLTDATFLPSALPGVAADGRQSVEILENGDGIFPPMLAAIAAAKKTVNFEAYIFWSGNVGTRFRDALAERATHGVEVRILLDAVGSPGTKLEGGRRRHAQARRLPRRVLPLEASPGRSGS